MSHRAKNRQAGVAEAREQFLYVVLAMMLIAGTTDWFGVFVTH